MAFGKCRSTWQLPLRLSFSGLRLETFKMPSRALSKSFSQDSDSNSILLLLYWMGCLLPFYCGAFHFQSSLSNLSSSTSFQPFKWLHEDELARSRRCAMVWVSPPFPFLLYFTICIYSCCRPNQWHLIKWRWLLLPHWQIVVVYLAAFWFWCVFDWLCGGTVWYG